MTILVVTIFYYTPDRFFLLCFERQTFIIQIMMNQPKLLYTLFCDNSTVDQAGKAVIFGTFNTIFAHNFPCQHLQMTLVTGWTEASGAYNQKVRITDPAGKLLFETQDLPFNMANAKGIHHLQVNFANLVFPIEGAYRIEVFLNGEKAQELKLYLEKAPAPPALH